MGSLTHIQKFKVSKSKTVVTRECLRKGSKYVCLQNLESKLYLTKICLKNYFWSHLPSTMFWQYILSPNKIIRFQTVFLFTLEDDSNKNWFYCFPSQFWPLKIKISPIFSYLYTELCDLEVLRNRFRPQFWYLPLKIAPETVGDLNRTKFFEANFNPLKLTFLNFFLNNQGQN